jgi:hypothetical protein
MVKPNATAAGSSSTAPCEHCIVTTGRTLRLNQLAITHHDGVLLRWPGGEVEPVA